MNHNSIIYLDFLKVKYGENIADKLLKYIELVLEKNNYINLTAVKDIDAAIEKHLMDSLSICDLEEYKKANNIIDVGTGAGFPGALLAIVSPNKSFTLLDSTLKRLKVIDEFADILDISNINTLHARAEEINNKEKYNACYDLCVSRAVANLDTLSKWSIPFVKESGYFIPYKGLNYQDELIAAEKTIKKLGAKLIEVKEVTSTADAISGHVLMIFKK